MPIMCTERRGDMGVEAGESVAVRLHRLAVLGGEVVPGEDCGQRIARCQGRALLGPRYGKLLAGIRAALEAADAEALAQRIACGNPIEVAVAGQAVVLQPDDLLVDARPRAHLSCAQESGTVVAVDTALTEALIQEGVARDLVRHIQNLRKECGFQVDDRIVITYRAGGAVADAIAAHEGYIRRETLAVQLVSHPRAGGLATVSVAGEEVGLKLERA